jgi:peptide/nickel transport system permease protein
MRVDISATAESAPGALAVPTVDAAAGRSGTPSSLASLWQAMRKDRFALAGLCIYAFFLILAIVGPYVAPHDPLAVMKEGTKWLSNEPPWSRFFLGTTNMGRDIFSELIWAARPAITVGFSAAFMVVAIGTIIGLLSGYFGGWVDSILMRLADIAFSIPFLPFVIVLAAFLKPSLWNIVLAMALLFWANTARVIRAQTMVVKERAFVEAARVAGASDWRILFIYVAPNVLPLAFLYGSLAMGWAILTEASVSFLGFGDPKVISWGYMLQDAYQAQAMSRGAWAWIIPPGLCIMLIVMAGFFIGRGTEELLYPRLKEQ